MKKRREALRVAGWIAMLAGAVGLTAGAFGGSDMGRVIGAYGMLLIGSGAWAVVGLELLERHERRSSRVPQASMDEQPEVVSR